MVIRILGVLKVFLLNVLICVAIYSPEDEVTKPPKRWVGLPWPVRVDKNSRHASGLIIGEEYIPPTLDYSSKNIMGRMFSSDDGIEHMKLTPGQLITSEPTRQHSNWDIVPDPSSDGGFRLVESSSGNINPAHITQQGSSSSLVYENGNAYEENVKGNNHEESSDIPGAGVTSGAVTSGVALAHGLQWPSKNVVGSGMLSAAVVGTGLLVGSEYHRPSASVLGKGVNSGGSGSSTKDNQPSPHMNWDVFPSSQLQTHSQLVSEGSGSFGTQKQKIQSSKIGWELPSAHQSQSDFFPAAHWHVASISVDPIQKLPSVATGVFSAAGQYLSSPSMGSTVEKAVMSGSTYDATKCPHGATGQFVYRPDCRQFLNCWKGRGLVQFCAPGTLFNPYSLECDFPNKVKCLQFSLDEESANNIIMGNSDERHIERDSRLVESAVSTRHPKTQTPSPVPVNIRKADCPMEGGTGLAPHPTDCSKFLNCWMGTGHTQQCGPGTLFNPQTLQCDFPYRVNCIVSTSGLKESAPRKFSPNKPYQPPQQLKPTIQPTRPPTMTSPTTRTTTTTAATTPANTTPAPLKPAHNVSLLVNPSGQVLRLRGGPGPWEGYVEVQGPSPGWGLVCDKRNSWSIVEATVVCQQLGYERGAELAWQGRPLQPTEDTLRVSVNEVSCGGNETTFSACQLEPGQQCVIARDAVGVRCYKNWASQCRPGEVNHGERCYNLVVPSVRHAVEGFSHGEALRDCQSKGSQLLDITSQEESDFISEWLLQIQPNITNILTAGVGVSVFQRPLWVWEGSLAPFKFTKWWSGWTNNLRSPPKTGDRPICIVAKRVFPCEHAYYTSDGISDVGIDSHEHQRVRMCAANYFYWDTEDCSITHSHPYVCERPLDDIGCVNVEKYNYQGSANVTASGLPCLHWDDPLIIPKLSYRVSERERNTTLTGHNYCRNVGGESQPWCFAGKQRNRQPCAIPSCWNKGIEKVFTVTARGCRQGEFKCRSGECITDRWKCDGKKDCSNGLDERDCGGIFENVSKHSNHRLEHHDREKWLQTDAGTCSQHCHEAKEFICRSFSHQKQDSVCLLSDSNIGLSGSLVAEDGWDYYEVKSLSVKCDDKFHCDNGKCINISLVCNGKNNCGDRSDEKNCSAAYLDYSIRLAGSNISHEGRVEVKVFGQWGLICDDLFGLRDAEVVCRELGFPLGAAKILPPGSYINRDHTEDAIFLVDDLMCLGNESSILECEFEGWGVHDCLREEAVSVMCSVPDQICASGFWKCESTMECVPIAYLCDNIDDCDDASDEDPTWCNSPIELRLVGGTNNMEGRVEVRYHGIWGTVCDDDFTVPAATVICRSLGFGGPAQAKKDGFFGPGEGQIWLDQLHCTGNETGITECLHSYWGEHNCQHSEDAAVICMPGDIRQSLNPHEMDAESRTSDVLLVNNILPSDCGKRSVDYMKLADDQKARVVGGYEVLKGSYPWQASVRVRTGGKSVHWCGAVVISPLHILTAGHCMQDYTKGAYFIRVGDHDTEEVEGTEQELNIDEIYLHEEFNKGMRLNNDIALVKMKGLGIRLGPEIMPACLPHHGIQYAPGLNCTISGWGSMKAAGSGYSRHLRATWIPLLPHETCKASFVYGTKAVGEGMFCAGMLEGGVDSCQGDSGGPLICLINGEFTLYGITSWGHGCGRPNKPGVYSSVSFYRDWIDNKLEDSMSGH
ncbi:uncharacterized protein LOC110841538 isoform X2 [Zootermopsis nevadensis]|uniref:uncharacterized protein LOC110841538 isoform X2 n=1 Tax=Zootermopsis nevadensis TaxID=136037 RepID=UPI000B8E5307|nr:uncharacterized protein LOC110841538 isoform X2 [Zootermopsis nevadensis]